MDEKLKNICLYGKYYNPAEKHYGKKCDVICDRCFRHNLDISIGWQELDLCLQCVQVVNDQMDKQIKTTEIKTYMLQNQFDTDKYLVRMMQQFYSKK